MTQKLLEEGWQEIARDQDFCCESHRNLYRQIYFAGAMNAMTAMTDWDPSAPGFDPSKRRILNPPCVHMIADELTAEWCRMEKSETDGAGHA